MWSLKNMGRTVRITFYRLFKKIKALFKRKPKAVIKRWYAANDLKRKLTIDDAKFILEQAEKVLKDSVETSEIIVSRTNTITSVVVALLVAFVGYAISHFADTKYDKLFYTASFGSIYLLLLIFYTYKNLKPKSYLIPGSFPIDLFDPAFFDKSIPNNLRLLAYYTNEIDNYQFKIEQNNKINVVRWNIYSNTLSLLIAFPVALPVIYFLLSFL